MVHIVIESLLSTSVNRVLFESLWNLAITKNYKQGFLKVVNDDQSISEICNMLIQEIRRDDPGRNNFYFTTQIAFGALLLYRMQIDKLYAQAKIALQSFNFSFYEINWLSQMTDPSTQVNSVTHNVKNNSTKGSLKRKRPAENLPTELDLLEQVFTIPDEPKQKPKGKNKSQVEEDDLDPTMAINAGHITLIENYHSKSVDYTNVIRDETDEFGGFDQDFDYLFHATLQNKRTNPSLNVQEVEKDQQMPDMTPEFDLPDVLRDTTATIPDIADFPEISLCEDVMNTVNKQKTRKRRSSIGNDISLRLQPALKALKYGEEFVDETVQDANNNVQATENNSTVNQLNDISTFDNQANDSETVNSDSTKEKFDFTSTFSVESPLNIIDIAIQPQEFTMSPPTEASIRKKKNRKIVVDKQTKIKDQVLRNNMENYQEKLTLKSPLDTFEHFMRNLKSSNDVFLMSPASRLKRCAKVLMPIFERNLKQISANLLMKRSCKVLNDETQLPAKKRRLDGKKELRISFKEPVMDYIEIPELPIVLDVQVPEEFVGFNQPLIPELDEIEVLPVADQTSVPTNDFIMPGDETEGLPENKPPTASQKSKKSRRQITENIGEYHEGEKWSKQMIMTRLKDFWDQDDDSISMKKLSAKSNRFIAAGTFFELMVLSKVGAVELTQDANLGIAHIGPGRHVKRYI